MWLTSDTLRSLVRNARSTLGHELPEWTTLWDGRRVEAPRRLKAMIEEWRSCPNLRQESDWAFAAYDGGDVVDVGAFHGWYALLLAPKARDGDTFVLCEPDTIRAIPHLHANLAFLSRLFPKVRFAVLPMPLGAGGEVVALHQPGNAAHPCWTDAPLQGSSVASSHSCRLDDVVSALRIKPRFLKIDVEGAEASVIEGGPNTLATFRPTLSLELHPQWLPPPLTPAEIEARLAGLGYRLRGANSDALSIRQLWCG
jgi:FkbM family methyltransferase